MIYKLSLILLTVIAFSCKNENYTTEAYLNEEQCRKTLIDISAYIEKKPEKATFENRFTEEFRSYYTNLAQTSYIKNYYIGKDSLHYFFVVKKERKSLYDDKRGVGGIYKTDRNKITEMDILFVTPMLTEENVLRKGKEMFEEMAREGNVKKYFEKGEYIEWPSRDVMYDKKTNRWIFPEGSKFKVFEGLTK